MWVLWARVEAEKSSFSGLGRACFLHASVSEPRLKPTQWAIAHSPQCRRVSAETGGKSEKQSKSRGAAEGRQKASLHSMRRNLHVRREGRPAGVVKNSRCSLRRMRCAYYEDCANAQNEELALLVE